MDGPGQHTEDPAEGTGTAAPEEPRGQAPDATGQSTAPALGGGTAPVRDLDRAERAAREFLDALGVDLTLDGRERTPRRMAQAYAELMTPREFVPTTFENGEGYDELVVVRDVPFVSVCEHHLLPFVGQATVGYLPGDRIVGLSKLARVVELVSRGPQVQERMTSQIATWVEERLVPRGVGVLVTAEHSCMTMRGARAHGASTTTSAMRGCLREDVRTRSEFLALAHGS